MAATTTQATSKRPTDARPAPAGPSPTQRPRNPATVDGSIRTMVGMGRDPLGFLLRTFVQHGDFVRLRFDPTPNYHYAYLAARPDHVEHVLKKNQANYVKAPTYRPIREFVGEGLLTTEGDKWLRHRRIAQPSFYKDKLHGWVELMGRTCDQMLSRWEATRTEPLDISLEFSRITLAVVGRVLFHTDLTQEGARVAPALAAVQSHIERRVLLVFMPRLFGLAEKLPTRENRRNHRAISQLDSILNDIIAGHRSAGDGEGDLLSSLMSAHDEGAGLTDSELRDEAMTFLLAGHETTANALTWTWYLLSKNPHVLEEMQAEIDSVVGRNIPTAADVGKLELTKAVIEESMRLYPPAWLIEREAVRDDEIDGYEIEAGSVLMVSPYVTHRHPDLWPNPEAFDPRRFLDRASTRHPFAYFPFGGGRRQCIGAGFAMLEAVVIAAMIVARYDFELVPGQKIEPDPRVTLGVKNGIQMNLRARA
jgi:cytochrome P450